MITRLGTKPHGDRNKLDDYDDDDADADDYDANDINQRRDTKLESF